MRSKWKKRTAPLWLLLSAGALSAIAMALAQQWMETDTKDRVYASPSDIPKRKIGLVLGCSSHLANGHRNLYFIHRIQAAHRLYAEGKIEYILVSGDNHVSSYDEAGAMKTALVRLGVPAGRIVCDYAGFSTIDSVIRAGKVFGQSRITIISQQFHVQRAVFIAKRNRIDAIGFCAADVSHKAGMRTRLRERLARVKTILDLYLLNRQPVYLGEPVEIGTVRYFDVIKLERA